MKPKSSTNYKKIVDAVLDQINHGQLQKGDKLPTELSLATKFDVSRTCVREAIKSLEAMGIVQSIQGSGSYITNTPELSINRPICALFALSNSTLENVLDLRIVASRRTCAGTSSAARPTTRSSACALWPITTISARRSTAVRAGLAVSQFAHAHVAQRPHQIHLHHAVLAHGHLPARVCSRRPGGWTKTR